jgi:GT2 family glycosyltransferase/2-polyprenyl-3-methyl-5-hydroxy-6-metoxy-1,4-benzoquinol methylase/tetratricopeptide (TPR) repeat protein
MKIGLVFDNRPRPETTGYYCRRALSRLVDVEHLLPDELPKIDASIFDLFVCIDDGLNYQIPDHCRPRAAWAIDTHMDFERTLRRFGDADFLLAAQKNGAAALQKALGRTVTWLPLACDPDVHARQPEEGPSYDIAFVGHVLGHRRTRCLELLHRRYPSGWIGQAVFDEMARLYSRARVGFNCSVADDLNMRLFEIPSIGIPCVTNHIEENGLEELFAIGEQLLTYRTEEELLERVDLLLNNPVLSQQIAQAGCRHVREHHTYHHRMVRLLEIATRNRTTVAVYKKSVDYFEFDRPDVRSLIPGDATRILDIGCAGGRLGEALKRDRSCHVTGIEALPEAAARAARRLDRVIQKSIEEVDANEFPARSYDCIVLADVLEHLRDPLSILQKCRQWLAERGSLVVSIPNSRHHSVLTGLANGHWTYERAGLQDEDHVRCFTRRELEKLLYRAGFGIQERLSIPGPGYRQWQESGRPGSLTIGRITVHDLPVAEAEELFVYQYLVRARPVVRRNHGLTSIVIVTFNELWATRLCVESVLQRTSDPIELIFVDNGSTDGTPDYLATIPGTKLIRNADNRGFAPAVNQGLQQATGEQMLLLNNDCIVTTGWLEGLLEALYDDDSNGLIGPVSNNVSGEQQIQVTYNDLSSLDGFAWDCRTHRRLTVTDRLVGFCLLFRRTVLERIGGFDERFAVGCFEDDDFCRQAANAGFRSLIAHHVFVHHFGSVTFRGAGIDLRQVLQENEQRYSQKWAAQLPSPVTAIPAPLADSEDPHQRYSHHQLYDRSKLLQRRHVRLSLCMIVRDNEDTIEACLDSIYPWVDEIIIVDTGSRDATQEICRRFGARVFEFPWCDDFSAARNESFRHAGGEWIFWMDSDDVIDQEQGRKLRALVYGSHGPDCLGYVAQVHCASADVGEMTTVDHVKVVRNLPDLRFEHRIHEQILPAIRRRGGYVEFTEIHVVHLGSRQTSDQRAAKLERDFRILAMDIADHPDHPFVLFNLGMTYDDAGLHREAESYLRRCLSVSEPGESHVRKAWALLLNSVKNQGKTAESLQLADEAIRIFPKDRELRFRKGTLLQQLDRHSEAIKEYQTLLDSSEERHFQSLDPSITGYKLHHNLALSLHELHEFPSAVHHWRLRLKLSPRSETAWTMLVKDVWETSHNPQQLRELHVQASNHLTHPESARLKAVCQELAGDLAGAVQSLQALVQEESDEVSLDELARLLMLTNHFKRAALVLEQLRIKRPDCAAVLHNLGNALIQDGESLRASDVLLQSLSIRPESPATRALYNTAVASAHSCDANCQEVRDIDGALQET